MTLLLKFNLVFALVLPLGRSQALLPQRAARRVFR